MSKKIDLAEKTNPTKTLFVLMALVRVFGDFRFGQIMHSGGWTHLFQEFGFGELARGGWGNQGTPAGGTRGGRLLEPAHNEKSKNPISF